MNEYICNRKDLEKTVERAVEKGFEDRADFFVTVDSLNFRLEQALAIGIGRLTYKNIKFWVGILVFAVAIGSGWATLQHKFETQSAKIDQTTATISEGGRYTQEEADRDNADIQRQIDTMNKKLDIIIEQTRN